LSGLASVVGGPATSDLTGEFSNLASNQFASWRMTKLQIGD